MADAKDITIEMDENGFRLMGSVIGEPVPLEFLNSIFGEIPQRRGIALEAWEKPVTRHGHVYDRLGIIAMEDARRKLVYSLGCYFQIDRSRDWCKGIGEFSGRAVLCGVPLKAGMVLEDAMTAMPFLANHLGWLKGEFSSQSALLAFSKNKEALASVPPYRRKAVPETLETLSIRLSRDWRWGTGKLPPEGEIGPPLPLGGW